MSTKQKLQLAQDIGEIIPLDPETCNQMVDYGLTLPNEVAISEHFSNMLGESDATSNFLRKFMEVKNNTKNKPPKSSFVAAVAATQPKKDPKNAWKSGEPHKIQPPAVNSVKSKKTSSTTTSALLKTKEEEKPKENKRSKRRNLDNLKDLEQLLNDLEVSKDKESLKTCSCNATRHPLFEIAPNCLNCGKIICVKEGLQPCSFCGNDIVSNAERQEIRKVLLHDKQQLELKTPKEVTEKSSETSKPKPKKIVISMNAGENLWQAQDKALKKAEAEKKLQHEKEKEERNSKERRDQQEQELQYYNSIGDKNPELIAAQERLNKLLEFQDNGEERTKIIDNAADYELTTPSSGNMWLSATERALRLKKQQKQLRKYEENELKRLGKGKRTVEMVIKDGKVTMVEKYGNDDDEDDEDDKHIKDLEQEIKQSKKKTEDSLALNVWDYEADQTRWDKPVYTQQRNIGTSSDELLDIKQRVQFNSNQDNTELVVNLY